jgi:hypothetical protein
MLVLRKDLLQALDGPDVGKWAVFVAQPIYYWQKFAERKKGGVV